jgi:hypothetical protein
MMNVYATTSVRWQSARTVDRRPPPAIVGNRWQQEKP